jgi:hypothetical protein
MSDGVAEFRKRWFFQIVCIDCGATFQFDAPDVGTKRNEKFKRPVILWVPETCPVCRNLKPVPPLDPKPPKKAA